MLEAFDGLRVADVSDGMDYVGLANVGLMDPGIHPLWKDTDSYAHRFIGIAITVRYVPTQDAAAAGGLSYEDFRAWEGNWYNERSTEPFAELIRPGTAIVIDEAPDADVGSIGSFNILAWQQWLAQQMLEACDLSTERPRYLIHDRDSSFGPIFDRRVKSLEIGQIRTPLKAPRANAIAERWIRSICNECLDHRLVLGHEHLQRTIDRYIDYDNRWRPHRSLGQSPPRAPPTQPRRRITGNVTAQPILGGLHHVYQWAA